MSSLTTITGTTGEDIGALVQELRKVSIFTDLPDAGLRWMAERLTAQTYKVGEVVIHEGAPADRMLVALSGEFIGRVENGPEDGRKYLVREGEVTGMLPYSRMKIFPP